jgi:regulator of protease activity HflC (stomatin/prohibitin superfamily)
MDPFLIFLILLVIVILILVTNVKVVPQAHAYVVERLGAYRVTWDTGLHFLVPFLTELQRRSL